MHVRSFDKYTRTVQQICNPGEFLEHIRDTTIFREALISGMGGRGRTKPETEPEIFFVPHTQKNVELS